MIRFILVVYFTFLVIILEVCIYIYILALRNIIVLIPYYT